MLNFLTTMLHLAQPVGKNIVNKHASSIHGLFLHTECNVQ
jgi:hypothetical protein